MPADREHNSSVIHQALADKLKNDGHIRSARIEAAFRAVPRHLFLPGVALDVAYSDEAVVTKRLDGIPISSSSQPAAMAIMLEQLALEPGHRVLEIGAGTGYNAALMAHVVGDAGQVITIDIDEDTVDSARQHLTTAGVDQVRVVCGDGGQGHPGDAPYDRIILTVGAWDIAPAWWGQLKPGGRLLVPLWVRGAQKTIAFEQTNGYLKSTSVSNCGFMRLRGACAGPEAFVQLGPDAGLSLTVEDQSQVDTEAIYQWLSRSSRDQTTRVQVTSREVWQGLGFWLALREPGYFNLIARGEVAERGIVPYLQGKAGKFCATSGLLGENTMCLLMRSPGLSPPPGLPEDAPPFELFVRTFGPGDELAQRLVDQVLAWDTAGRPGTENLSVQVYPLDMDYTPSANEAIVSKHWTRLIFAWH